MEEDSMENSLVNSVRIYEMIREQLMHEYELLPEDQCLIDTLDGLTDLKDKIAALVRESVRTKAMADALKFIIDDNITRKRRFEDKAERLRALVLHAMSEAGIPKIDAADMTISNSPGPQCVIIKDEDAVPDYMCKIERTPMKTKIAEELKRGGFVPYAVWSNPERVLTVRTK
jgi:hypothetical protein